jgi:hypothetical protein
MTKMPLCGKMPWRVCVDLISENVTVSHKAVTFSIALFVLAQINPLPQFDNIPHWYIVIPMETRAEYKHTVIISDRKQFHLRLSTDMYQQVKEAAAADRRTMTQIITIAIEEWLKTKGG